MYARAHLHRKDFEAPCKLHRGSKPAWGQAWSMQHPPHGQRLKKDTFSITTKTSALLERSSECSVVHREQSGFACLCGYCYKVPSVYTTLPVLTCPSDGSAIKYDQRFNVTSGLAGIFSSEKGARCHWKPVGFGCLDVEAVEAWLSLPVD